MNSKYDHPRNILVSTLQRLYDYGMTTTSGGNLSIKDEGGNIWITPSGIDKGTLRPEDIMQVTPDGKIIGLHTPSVELPFHRSVYKLRKDVRAVLHAHSPAMVAFSLVGRIPDSKLVPGIAETCGKVAFAKYEIPGSQKLGDIIAAEFAKGADSVIMENHGAVMCGKTIAEAFAKFEALDYMARIQINASSLAKLHDLKDKQVLPKWGTFVPKTVSPKECEIREKMVRFSTRCYKQGLMFTGAACIAARIADGADDFVTAPAGFDQLNPEPGDFVRICKGKIENGKIPSEAAAYCREIFKKHKDINAIMVTRSPNFMAYAASGTPMDSRTIPESYIQLRDIPVMKAKDFFGDTAAAAKMIKPSVPVLMIENYGLLTTGKNLINAFDRMEVGEFTAKCLILASRIGKFKPITQKQVNDIIKVFGLPE